MKIRLQILFLLFFVATLLPACSGDNHQHHPSGVATQRDVVEWPVIRTLDNLAHLGEVAAETNDAELMVETAQKMVNAAESLTAEGIPANARSREQVVTLVNDLRSVLNALAEGLERKDTSALAHPLKASHVLVSNIMETAGMPHHHDHHDHDDCDDHDHQH